MTMLPYADLVGDPALDETLAKIVQLRGQILNLYRILGNQPSALVAFMGMSEYVRDRSSLPGQLRELTILATAQTLDVPYERFHHEPIARRLGISDQKLEQLARWPESTAFAPAERAAIAYADEVGRTRQVSAETFAELRVHFTTAQIIDVALTVGWYHLCAALIKPLGVEIEE